MKYKFRGNEIEFDDEDWVYSDDKTLVHENWKDKHRMAIEINYKKAQFFEKYWYELENLLNKKYEKLIELNFALIDYFISELKIKTKIVKSSKLKNFKSGSEKLLDICTHLDTSTYVSGELVYAKNYP